MGQENNQLSIIDNIEKSVDIFRGGGAILIANQNKAAKALKIAESVLSDWDKAYSTIDPEQKKAALSAADLRSNKFLVNCGVAVKEMAESRKAVTQLMDTLKEMFTAEENSINVTKGGKSATVQAKRNEYAKWTVEEKKRQDKIAQDKADKLKEETNIKATVNNIIAQWLLKFLSERLVKMTTAFNGITLENYKDKCAALQTSKADFPDDKLVELVITMPYYVHYDEAEAEAIKNAAVQLYDYSAYKKDYKDKISAKKKELIDKLPSKKAELDEAERLRLEAIENENKRQAELEKTKNETARKLLQQQQEQQRQQEIETQRQAEQVKKDREAAEQKRLKDEADNLALQQEQKKELEITAGNAASLFALHSEITDTTPQPQIKTSVVVKVIHPAGWVEMFTFWYQREGVKMSLEDLEKKTFKQVKSFCEKSAKDGERIESKFLVYSDAHKAVNKKEKVKAD